MVNPAVFDVRFPWADWHQPANLFRLATLLGSNQDADVRFVDLLEHTNSSRVPKQQVEWLNVDGQPVVRWRYGQPLTRFEQALRRLANQPWSPDVVLIECLTTFWWEGAAEAAESVRRAFPRVQLGLVGIYPEAARRHAVYHVRPQVLLRNHRPLADVLPAVRGNGVPNFLLVSLGSARRSAEEVASDIRALQKSGVCQFAICTNERPDAARKLAMVLEALATWGVKTRLFGLGELSAQDVLDEPALPLLMKRAGYREICLKDDRHIPMSQHAVEEWLESHRKAAELFIRAGFESRTRSLTGSVCVGRLGEDLSERVSLIAQMAHIIGSVIVWPYQPAPSEFARNTPLHMQNGKLFPHRTLNGYTYRSYLEVLGLAAILNSKYRDKTFDFLSSRLIPRLFRQSVTGRGWDPDPNVKGTTRLPALAPAQA